MPLNTFTPAHAPDVGLSGSAKFRILESQFGDGYKQRAGDGINTLEKKYNLSWNNLPNDDIDDIIEFLDGQKGYIAFNYTLPNATASQKFICKDYGETWIRSGDEKSCSAVFEVVFDL
jgi:phage-related protein